MIPSLPILQDLHSRKKTFDRELCLTKNPIAPSIFIENELSASLYIINEKIYLSYLINLFKCISTRFEAFSTHFYLTEERIHLKTKTEKYLRSDFERKQKHKLKMPSSFKIYLPEIIVNLQNLEFFKVEKSISAIF